MFLKLKDLISSPSFLEIDPNNDGWVLPKDFKEKMEQQKSYTPEEIEFLLGDNPSCSSTCFNHFLIFQLVVKSTTTEKLTTSGSAINSTSHQKKSVSFWPCF
jgi:hypothetical protein